MTDFEAFSVDRQALVTDLVNMIRIPSVNCFGANDPQYPAEAAMADYLEKRLNCLGISTESRVVSDGRRNVWGTVKGTGDGPTVLLAGHLDTVGVEGYDGPFDPKAEDGKIFGRGSCDMKAGLAAYLEVARILIETERQLSGDLIIAGVVDEEHAMIGSKDYGVNGPQIDYAIVAEPTSLAICPAHKGQICMTIKTHGLAAHSSMPEKGTNAIYHMGDVVQALRDYADTLGRREPDAMCGQPSFSIGVIRGGDNACSVPDFCEIDVDRRTIPGETYETVMAELRDVMKGVQARLPGLQCEFADPFLNLPPLATPHTSPVMVALQTGCELTLGAPSPVSAFPGSTDAPNFNCPTVICGAGDLAQCHSLNEYIAIDEIESAVKIYLNAIIMLQGS